MSEAANDEFSPQISVALSQLAKLISNSSSAAVAIAKMSPVVESLALSKKVQEEFIGKHLWAQEALQNSEKINRHFRELSKIQFQLPKIQEAIKSTENIKLLAAASRDLSRSLAIVSLTQQLENSNRNRIALAQILERQIPKNWRGTKVTFSKGFDVAKVYGISLAYIPRTNALFSLAKRGNKNAKELSIFKYRRSIVNECKDAIQKVAVRDTHDYFLLEAIETYKKGHWAAAQSLSANIIDSTLNRLPIYSQSTGSIYARVRSDFSDIETIELGSFGGVVALTAVAKAVYPWRPNTNTPIPDEFNRHVTSHQISHARIDEITVVNALMTACSLRLAEADRAYN